jgi:hypothetical protein
VLYLNGKEIYRHTTGRAFRFDQDEVAGIRLQPGVNRLVFKVVNQARNWAGSVRFTDADDQPVEGIRVTLDPGSVR